MYSWLVVYQVGTIGNSREAVRHDTILESMYLTAHQKAAALVIFTLWAHEFLSPSVSFFGVLLNCNTTVDCSQSV